MRTVMHVVKDVCGKDIRLGGLNMSCVVWWLVVKRKKRRGRRSFYRGRLGGQRALRSFLVCNFTFPTSQHVDSRARRQSHNVTLSCRLLPRCCLPIVDGSGASLICRAHGFAQRCALFHARPLAAWTPCIPWHHWPRATDAHCRYSTAQLPLP